MDVIAEASPQRWARTAGAMYLIIIIGGFFAIGLIPGLTLVSGDTAATARNIQSHELLYRLGLADHMVLLSIGIPLTLVFYYLFRVVNRPIALLVVFFLLVGTAVEGANMLNQFVPLVLLDGGPYSGALTAQQLHALSYLALDLETIGYDIQQVFYAFYLVFIGYLVFKSTFVPRTVGVLLAIAGLCYLTYSFATFVAPGFASHLFPYIQLPSFVGEASLCLWLLFAGVNVERWMQQAGAAGTPALRSPASGDPDRPPEAPRWSR